jgi:hypothetical protein
MKYRDWLLKYHRCCITGSREIHLHHIRTFNNSGMGIKPSDDYLIPLNPKLHMELHQIGQKQFELLYGVKLERILKVLHELYKQECKK